MRVSSGCRSPRRGTSSPGAGAGCGELHDDAGPRGWPLRRPARIAIDITGADLSHAALYTARAGSWSTARSDTAAVAATGKTLAGEALELGRVAVLRDLAAPRLGLGRAVRIATNAPNRRAFQCAIIERGSGIDVTRTHFVVDGRQVPSEWDSEHGILRWRPLHALGAGAHRYEIVATDRAGLESRGQGRLVTR